MTYVILEKDGKGTDCITDMTEAMNLVADGYKVRINKAGWDLNKKIEKKPVKKKKKKSK